MTINIKGPQLKVLRPRILVLGVGGAGGNAINKMIEDGIQGVEFVAVNTDAQDLQMNKAETKIQIGTNLTGGLGAGAKHDVGQAAADESLNDIVDYIKGSNMVFITAGMGGGTGTGASHVIARAAKELNILTVGVVTLPFSYEGPKRMTIAQEGLDELKKHLDTNIVVPNQNLFKIINEKTSFKDSFGLSNDVLKFGVQSVTDLMVKPGLVNLDFADVETIMKGMGKAMMGTGEAEGENRAEEASNAALNNPLIDEYSLRGAKGLLLNITGGSDLTTFEVDKIANKIRAEVSSDAEYIFGSTEDQSLNGKIRVSIVATALDGQEPQMKPVVSMVHRIQNRNINQNISTNNSFGSQINTLPATEGATALNINQAIDEQEKQTIKPIETKEAVIQKETINEPSLEDVSIENATYLQNTEESTNQDVDKDISEFEVDSIELASPKLFSDEENISNAEETNEKSPEASTSFGLEKDFDNKEPEMFDNLDSEENLEIPAFLRRQKN